MSDKERDKIIWDTIISFYKEPIKNKRKWSLEQMEQARQENQEKAYWCREAGDNQKLFIKPEQRLMARLIKSFLNTSYKGGYRKITNDENWFDEPEIIFFLQEKINNNSSNFDTKLKDFVTDACALLTKTTQLTNDELNQEQTANLKALRDIVNSKYDAIVNPEKPQDWNYDEMIVAQVKEEPYITILKMKKLIRGFGIALTCDFLKESHLYNIAKPDVHLRHVFSMIDRIPYSEDLILVKRISEFAEHVDKKPDPEDFCNSGPYYIDKIIWMLCSRNKEYKNDNGTQIKIPDFKKELLKRIAAKLQEID
jgi:hypothetical protein